MSLSLFSCFNFKPGRCLILCLLIFWQTAQANPDTTGFGSNKTIPAEIRPIALLALAHYPELKNVNIVFEYSNGIHNAFMQARPKPLSLLGYKNERVYRIIMTPSLYVNDKKIPIDQLPDDVLLGWLGHELGHIMDYHQRRWFQLLGFGIAYLIYEPFKIEAERRADLYAIEHGLSDAIVATKNYILDVADFPEYYKNKIRGVYMSPDEVIKLADEDLDELQDEVEDREEVLEGK